jgi:hypothetical protein
MISGGQRKRVAIRVEPHLDAIYCYDLTLFLLLVVGCSGLHMIRVGSTIS